MEQRVFQRLQVFHRLPDCQCDTARSLNLWGQCAVPSAPFRCGNAATRRPTPTVKYTTGWTHVPNTASTAVTAQGGRDRRKCLAKPHMGMRSVITPHRGPQAHIR